MAPARTGSILEGGGQVVRVTSALSALLGVPIRLDKIRAGRAKGGLAAQHAAGLKLVAQAEIL
jgi:RNA 3'-terminal phosphate cyclase (ATP)